MVITHGGDIFGAAARHGVDWRGVLDFSASINPLGPSPAAREAILAAMNRVAHYPSRDGVALRSALAAHWGVDAERIVTGNGATEMLFDWARSVGSAGAAIAAPAFSEFHRAWPNAKLCELERPESWPAVGPLVLTRPANPTGHVADARAILACAHGRRDPVLVDESFLDFVAGAESLLPHARGNLFVLRSLTKFWALPGLRVGALVGDVGSIAAARPSWQVNALAEAAAIASIHDTAHAAASRAFVAGESRWLHAQLAALPGLRVLPPTANFLFVETAQSKELTEFMSRRHVLIRDCQGWPGFETSGVRVAVRRHWENEILIELFREFSCES